MDAKVTDTSLARSNKANIDVDGIMVGDPLEWLAILVNPEKRICDSFDEYMISFYECLFSHPKIFKSCFFPTLSEVMGIHKCVPTVCRAQILEALF